MTIWIVTKSHCYYPCSGTDDWISVHTDEEEAHAAFAEVETDSYSDKTLIKVDPPSFWEVWHGYDEAAHEPF